MKWYHGVVIRFERDKSSKANLGSILYDDRDEEDVAVLHSEMWRILKLKNHLNHKSLPLIKTSIQKSSVNLKKATNRSRNGNIMFKDTLDITGFHFLTVQSSSWVNDTFISHFIGLIYI